MHIDLVFFKNCNFRILLQTKDTVFLFESFIIYIYIYLFIYFVSFLRLTTLTCGPDDADRLSQVSAALSPLPFLFKNCNETLSLNTHLLMQQNHVSLCSQKTFFLIHAIIPQFNQQTPREAYLRAIIVLLRGRLIAKLTLNKQNNTSLPLPIINTVIYIPPRINSPLDELMSTRSCLLSAVGECGDKRPCVATPS